MSKTAPTVPRRLTDKILLFQPNSSNDNPKTCPVSLAVLCTWTGASPKHIEKYTTGYSAKWPGISILVIKASVLDQTYRSEAAQQPDLIVARDIIQKHKQELDKEQQIVLHIFSNGGAYTAVQLLKVIGEDSTCFHKVILDSCPGCFDPITISRAITAGLPQNALVQAPATACLYLWAVMHRFILHSIGQREVVTLSREELWNKKLFPPDIPRLYLYSKTDQIVDWKDVHSHAEESLQRGYEAVEETEFPAGSHCNLLAKDAQKYWAAVNAAVQRPAIRPRL